MDNTKYSKFPIISESMARYFGLGAFALCVVIQICYIISFWGMPPLSDCYTHFELADYCRQHGEWYPAQKDIYHIYILAPTLINYYLVQLRLFGSFDFNSIINLLMACVITYEIWYIGLKTFNRKTAWLAVGIWSLLYSTWTSVVPAATELPFLVLALGGVCLCYRRSWWAVILAGVFIALANTIRPLVVIFVPWAIAVMYVNRYNVMRYLTAALAALAVVVLVGTMVYAKIGYFVAQSSTGGLNLGLTANSAATGNNVVFYANPENEMYIDDFDERTFAEKDSIWKARAIEWIKENPGRYTKLYFFKLAALYSHDTGFDGYLYKNSMGYSSAKVQGLSYWPIFFKKVAKSIWYYLVLIGATVAIIVRRRDLLSMKGMVLTVTILGTAATALFSVMTRYHYPLMFPIVLWCGYGLTFLQKKRKATAKPAD